MAESTKPATLNLYQKLAAITGEIGAIKKGGTNSEQKYAFIEYAAVAGELRGLFAKHGVIIVPRMQQTIKQHRVEVLSKYDAKGTAVLVDMTFTVVNADAPDDKFTVTWTGEAIDFGDKATNKAATSALKYYLMRQFNISEKGDDPDAVSPDRGAVKAQVTKIERDIAQMHETTPLEAAALGTPNSPSLKQLEEIRSVAMDLNYEPEAIDKRLHQMKTPKEAEEALETLRQIKAEQERG